MPAPDLRQRYGNRTHGEDIVMGHASWGRHTVALVVVVVKGWFDRAARSAWRTAAQGAWRASGGVVWRTAASGGGWRAPASGGWREEADC